MGAKGLLLKKNDFYSCAQVLQDYKLSLFELIWRHRGEKKCKKWIDSLIFSRHDSTIKCKHENEFVCS